MCPSHLTVNIYRASNEFKITSITLHFRHKSVDRLLSGIQEANKHWSVKLPFRVIVYYILAIWTRKSFSLLLLNLKKKVADNEDTTTYELETCPPDKIR